MSDNVFQVWILRSNASDRPFSLRFRAESGRGMFVLPRSGVTAAPPASTHDELSGLSAKEVLVVRYVHIEDQSRVKTTWTTASIEINGLLNLPVDKWIQFLFGSSGVILLPDLSPSIELHNTEIRRSTNWAPRPKTSSNKRPPQHHGTPRILEPNTANEQTATERILDLEAQISQSNQRVAQLKTRVAKLERDVERLGGTVEPWVLDPRK